MKAGRELGVEPVISSKEMSDPEVDHLGVMAYAAWLEHLKPQTVVHSPTTPPLVVTRSPTTPPVPTQRNQAFDCSKITLKNLPGSCMVGRTCEFDSE